MAHTFSRSAHLHFEEGDSVVVTVGGPDESAAVTKPTANPAGVVTFTIKSKDGSLRDHFISERDFTDAPTLEIYGGFADLEVQNHLPDNKLLIVEITSDASRAKIDLVGNFTGVRVDAQGVKTLVTFDGGKTLVGDVKLAPGSELSIGPNGYVEHLQRQNYVFDAEGHPVSGALSTTELGHPGSLYLSPMSRFAPSA